MEAKQVEQLIAQVKKEAEGAVSVGFAKKADELTAKFNEIKEAGLSKEEASAKFEDLTKSISALDNKVSDQAKLGLQMSKYNFDIEARKAFKDNNEKLKALAAG